jgi:hypothetical protein
VAPALAVATCNKKKVSPTSDRAPPPLEHLICLTGARTPTAGLLQLFRSPKRLSHMVMVVAQTRVSNLCSSHDHPRQLQTHKVVYLGDLLFTWILSKIPFGQIAR